jgi:type IV pilus assembly protein PilO
MGTTLTKRSLIIIVLLILFLALFYFYYFVLVEMKQEIRDKEAEIRASEDQIQMVASAIQKKKAQQPMPEFRISEIIESIPYWDNEEQLVRDFRRAQSLSGVTIENISFSISDGNTLYQFTNSEEPIFPTLKEVEINLVVNGSYQNIKEFVKSIQQFSRLLLIRSSSYTSEAQMLQMNLSLTGYFDPTFQQWLDQEKLKNEGTNESSRDATNP